MNKHEKMMQRIEKHGKDLQVIFNTDMDAVTLAKKLRRIETKTSYWTLALCNGDIEQDVADAAIEKIKVLLDKLLGYTAKGIPVKINYDPRGYALKIDDEYVRAHNLEIYRDWGGYGILAPDLTEP